MICINCPACTTRVNNSLNGRQASVWIDTEAVKSLYAVDTQVYEDGTSYGYVLVSVDGVTYAFESNEEYPNFHVEVQDILLGRFLKGYEPADK